MQKKYFYLVKVQYLGYRYHGWQKQPNLKTVQKMVEKTFRFVLGDEEKFKVLISGRTDAMVSANNTAFELFTESPMGTEQLFKDINWNLPADIRILNIKEVEKDFNIIKDPKVKEYIYIFSFGEKPHPFAAPFLTHIRDEIDLDLMKAGAKLFEGTHNFQRYCYKPSEDTKFERTIESCEIVANDVLEANFFPENTQMFRIRGKGFMRHQIRLMMGTLIRLGKGELSLEDIQNSLKGGDNEIIGYVAPASGLILNDVKFD